MGTKDEDEATERYFRYFTMNVLPHIKMSALQIAIIAEPDAKVCLEMGAAVLFDKPIIVLAVRGQKVPENLRRCAVAVIEGDPNQGHVKRELQKAIEKAMKDPRAA